MELASALGMELGWDSVLLGRNEKDRDWYDVAGLGCLIVLLESYDIRKLQSAGPGPLKIAWIRNWTDQWISKPWFGHYDVVLCSSEIARRYIADKSGRDSSIFRIASNVSRFNAKVKPVPELKSDYCFTGNFWGARRKIEALAPSEIPYEFALFGKGWQGHRQFAEYWRGSLPYERLPAVYRSTAVLIDDANHVTAPWGSVNSRVFDALACGTLVLTNGREGAREVFGEKLPTWSTMAELKQRLIHFLDHPTEREALAGELRQLVCREHSYEARAAQLREVLTAEFDAKARVAIKIPVASVKDAWRSDPFHLARGLASELRNLGYAARIDFIPDWQTNRVLPDDVVLCVDGANRYAPAAGERSVLWITNYPEDLQPKDCDVYDRVLVASRPFAAFLSSQTSTKVECFLPCTDPNRFPFSPEFDRSENLVVSGNARSDVLPIYAEAVNAGFNPVVIGDGWDRLIDPSSIEINYLDDASLARIYPSSGAVLCGHSLDAKQHGFIDRRLFDILFCGGIPVTDDVRGIAEVFGELVHVYDGSPGGLKQTLEAARNTDASSGEYRMRIDALIDENCFRARAVALDAVLSELLGLKGSMPGRET